MSTGRKLLYSAVTVLAFVCAIETVARVVWRRMEARAFAARQQRGEQILRHDAVNYLRVADGLYGYKLKPGAQQGPVTISAQGFHQRDIVPVERRTGFLRVMCLGESTTFGSGVDVNYPAYLRQILEQHGRGFQGYEVINAGVPGWVSDQVALRAEHELAAFRPDVVILYVGWNDFQSYDPTSHPPTMSYFDYEYGGTKWKRYATTWLKSVALASAWYHARAAAAPSHAAGPAASPAECYRFLLANLDRTGAAFRHTNPAARIFVSTLVGRWPQGKPEEWAHTPPVWWIRQHGISREQAAQFVAALNDELRDFARRRNLPLIDAAAAFDPLDRSRLLWDWAHLYPEGYELLAWTMFDALQQTPAARHSELLEKYRLKN